MKRALSIVILFLCLAATSWALLPVKFFRVHDYTHAARISEMTRALADGHFPVRWSQNLGFGYGMPLFNFYAPLPYYVGSAFYSLGFDIVLSIKFLFVISNILVIIGSYKLGRLYFGRSGALLVAVLIALAPYRALNLYIRGALSESWALSFLPWILYYAVLTLRGVRQSYVGFAFSLAGLALTHNITLILSFPILLLFTGFEWIKLKVIVGGWRIPQILEMLFGGVLAFGLSAFYLLPAFLEKGFTQVDDYILDYYFSYQLHFLYIRQFFDHSWRYGGSGWGPNDDISFGLGIGQLIALGISACCIAWFTLRTISRKNLRKLLNYKWFWLSLAVSLSMLTALLMTLEKTLLVWQSIPILKYAQFPWRWLTVAVPFVGLLGAIGTQLFAKKAPRYGFVFLLLCITFIGNAGYFRPEFYLDNASDYYSTSAEGIRGGMSSILPDYIPKELPKKISPAVSLIVNQSELGGSLKVLTDSTHQKLISVSLSKPQEVIFSVANFPGWQVEVDGAIQEKLVTENGLIAVAVPTGEHTVGLVLKLTSVQLFSQIISVLALIVTISGLLWSSQQRKVSIVSS